MGFLQTDVIFAALAEYGFDIDWQSIWILSSFCDHDIFPVVSEYDRFINVRISLGDLGVPLTGGRAVMDFI